VTGFGGHPLQSGSLARVVAGPPGTLTAYTPSPRTPAGVFYNGAIVHIVYVGVLSAPDALVADVGYDGNSRPRTTLSTLKARNSNGS
jgi:hypothetical protein